MYRIIGTAGHIDHGKTSLIKALTGQDTDRLKEEKERGISIDLGFAYLDLPDGTRAGIVDVPGHERFIRNMLAGAHGMDLVLFVVAADDGVMPQTEEHFDIVRLLGVQQALFVVTKADKVPESRVDEVTEEIKALSAGTVFEHSSAVPFSLTTGRGLEELRARIVASLQTVAGQHAEGYFRLPIDRAFVAAGHGLVVTGTTVSGEVRVGDRVRCMPGGHDFRVRTIHVHNEPVAVAARGQRTALNLSTREKTVPARGDVICDERIATLTDRFDARLELRRSIPDGIESHQRIRVYAGTGEYLGRVVVLGPRDRMTPGETAYCQIAVADPLVVLRRDRFIIRDECAQRTLGGGIVLHPSAKKHSRTEPQLDRRLKTLDEGDLAAVVETFLADSGEFAVSLDRLRRFLNLREEESRVAMRQIAGLKTITVGENSWYARAESCERLGSVLVEFLASFHASHPLAQGLDVEEARARVAGGVPPDVFRSFVEELTRNQVIVRAENWLRLSGHRVELGQADADLAARVKNLLAATPLAPPDLKQMGETLKIDQPRLLEVLRVMERERSVQRLTTDLYFLRESIETAESELRRHFAGGAAITPGDFRDRLGTTRKYVIPLLEYFDRQGVTVRRDGARQLRLSSHVQVGQKP